MPATTDRLEKLTEMLAHEPSDTFLLYAMAMEHKKLNNAAETLRYLHRVLEIDPGYCVAHHQAGIVHETAGDTESARKSYIAGIAAAKKVGNAHAGEEMQAALDMLD